MTDGWGPLDSFRMRAGDQKDQPTFKGLGFSASLQPPGMGKGPEIELATKGQ